MIKERGHNKAKPAACSTISTSLHGFLWTSFSHCLVFHLWTHDLFQPTVDFVERWQSLLLRWGLVQEITFHQNLKCCNGDWGQIGQIVLAWWLRANWTNCACRLSWTASKSTDASNRLFMKEVGDETRPHQPLPPWGFTLLKVFH